MKKFTFFFKFIFLFISFSNTSFSQTNLDSLWTVWEDETQIDSVRMEAMAIFIMDGYLHSQPDSAFYFAQLQYDMAKDLNLLNWMSTALVIQGSTYLLRSDFEKAKKLTEEGIALGEDASDKSRVAGGYLTLGLIYQNMEDPVMAIEIYTKCRKLTETLPETIENTIRLGSVLTNMGSVYYEQGDRPQALNYYQEALELQESVKDDRNTANTLSNIGWVYYDDFEDEKAMDYYNRAYKLHKSVGNLNNSAITLLNIGNVYGRQGKNISAFATYNEALKISKEIGNKNLTAHLLQLNGVTAFNQKKYKQSIKFHEEAFKLSEELGSDDTKMKTARTLSLVYREIGNYKKALEYYETDIRLKDSLINEENQRAILRQEYQYNYDKQSLADSLAFAQKETLTNLELEKNQATLSQQRLGLVATVLGLLLLGALAYFFYQSKKRQEVEADRIKELDAFKSTFYTNITHEFRTPLTVILGMANQIEEKPEKFLEEGIGLIKRNGKNLLSQINQILDLSKLETNSLQVNMVQSDVVEFLRYSTEAFQSFANGQNLSLRFFSPVEKLLMDYDPESLQNIMSNLISNAMKFTSDGGDVKVALEKTEEQIIIKVEDTGAGISEKDLPYIFDRFYQVENKKGQNANGTGIGLAYVRELVKMLGGEISVESELGKGTSFAVTLPIRNEAALIESAILKKENLNWIPSQARVDKIGATKATIDQSPVSNESLPQLLLIEDNADVVIYLKSCLSELYQIDVAYNGRIGIEKALENVPDLIISDVMMPDKDGFEVCDTLKNDERTSHIPLILLTAKADVASKLAGLKRGADAYLSKPFDKEELLVRLEMLVERQKRMVSYFSKNDEDNLKENTDVAVIEIEDVFIKKINAILEENISDEDFGLPQLCQKVRMSRSQLFRKMKALTDTAPSAFIKSYRLDKAKRLLESTEMNVAEAAYEVGFKDPSYFSKIFQEEFGRPPSMV